MAESEEPPAPSDASVPPKKVEDAPNGAKAYAEKMEDSATPAEVDEFGLPIRKPRRPPVEMLSSDDEAEGNKRGDKAKEAPKNSIGSVAQSDSNKPKELESQPTAPADPQAIVNATEKVEKAPDSTITDTTDASDTQHDQQRPKVHVNTVTSKRSVTGDTPTEHSAVQQVSEWSHQQIVPQPKKDEVKEEDEWQDMPAYAPFDLYNDDGKLIAKEALESDDEFAVYGNLGGAGKGYTRVQIDEDAQSATSMDDNTAYLFKERGTDLLDDEEARDPLAQMQATKNLLTEGQRIAYVGLVRLAMVDMVQELDKLERTKGSKKNIDVAVEAMKMWSQKMMVRLYSHMEIESAEQIMIEQLAEHGVQPHDLTPSLMQNARVKNPMTEDQLSDRTSVSSPQPTSHLDFELTSPKLQSLNSPSPPRSPPPPYQDHEGEDLPEVRTPSQLPKTASIDIDLRWTVLCDLFLVLIADSIYDARSRQLLERVGGFLDVSWLEICRFEKRVVDALEMQEAANKENWDENEHMESRKKMARNRRLLMMGLATVGGGLVIGLSAGLLAPVIGAGLAAGFTTIGVAGTSTFLGSAGAAALITSTGIAAGGTIGVRAANRRTGAVKTFEYRPLHNNKRVNLIVTVAGWMTGKVDDIRLPYSTVDPIMGDIYSVFWEPEMLQSMGDTINILATEALTQGLQQILGSTILIALMASLQAPIVLTKLSYLIDNPWSVSLARADAAGLILADSLIDRNLGARPVTLVGFSLGSRLIFSCLRELARKGAFGLIQNVYIFGSPVVVKNDEYLKVLSIVNGRFVNGYATNDWILGYLFRATSGGIMRVAGLAPAEIPGVENIDVTSIVAGHMAYRAAMPRLLRECGWIVESDEFTEIEDPDPDNHEKRQRELINEIEEARKELEKKPEKRRFGLFKKKALERQEWETYDENMKAHPNGEDQEPAEGKGGVLFDVDAIRSEAAQIAAYGIEIKQLESTLPPLKLDLSNPSSLNPQPTLRETKSFNDSIGVGGKGSVTAGTNMPPKYSTNSYEYDEYDDLHQNGGEITMSFEPAPSKPSKSVDNISSLNEPKLSHYIPEKTKALGSTTERPPLSSSYTAPSAANTTSQHNVWADEYDDDFGKEKELELTFE